MRGAARRSIIRDRVLLAAVAPVIAGALAVAPSANAATVTWGGGNATSPHWDQPSNWDLGFEPGPGDDAIFPSPIPAPPGATIVLGAGESANSLTFRDAYTLSVGG